MTSATPAPAACGAQLTTIQVDPNTSARLYTMLNSQATPMLMWPSRYLQHLPEPWLRIVGTRLMISQPCACLRQGVSSDQGVTPVSW